jgi:biopolymer transport protein TolQ
MPILVLMQMVESEAVGNAGFWSLLQKMGGSALAILILLLVFSLVSWAIILRKWLTFRHVAQQSHAFVAHFRKCTRLSEVSAAGEHYRGTPLSGIFAAGYHELNTQIQNTKDVLSSSNPGHPVLSDLSFIGIQRSLQRAAAAELSLLERSLGWLATTGSVTPFIGLLGTVIGIINAFQGLGMEKTASIQAVAPGIAEALFSTAAGLFAAIPAVIGYNHFINRIKNIAVEMDDFSSEFLNLVERSFS